MPPKEESNVVDHVDDLEHFSRPTRVAIIGAGPAGLLSAIFLLRRNLVGNRKYQVILIDPGTDYGKLQQHELARFRSWMIGLSAHGLSAVQEVPELYEKYLANLGVKIQGATIGVGSFSFKTELSEKDKDTNAFTVDRNYICAGLARYLIDHFEKPVTTEGLEEAYQEFISHYNTKVMFVDAEEKHLVLKKKTNGNDSGNKSCYMDPIPYDIVLGCDGARSVVRNSFLMNHRDFEFTLKDNFGRFKSVHIKQPKDIPDGHFMMLMNCMPRGMGAVVLPEKDNVLNVGIGNAYSETPDPALLSKDPKVVTEYFRNHFKILGENLDHDEIGNEWVKQEFSTTSMCYCNFYHSNKIMAILLGDAAHATVPNIGQGMNTALADASVLNKLLDTFSDCWEDVLPAFSKERVKEGNALTTLSFHTFSLSAKTQIEIFLRQTTRQLLTKVIPTWLMWPDPMSEIPRGMKLSEAYDKMMKIGWLKRSRQINEEIMRCHFEEESGMVVPLKKKTNLKMIWFSMTIVCFAIYYSYFMAYTQQQHMGSTLRDLVDSTFLTVMGKI